MTLEEFLDRIHKKSPPASEKAIRALELKLGAALPDDYRRFLVACNGGHLGGVLWFIGPTPDGVAADVGINHVYGVRTESRFDLQSTRRAYGPRIPRGLLAIADDCFGNLLCLGLDGVHRGRLYFWDHECEPDACEVEVSTEDEAEESTEDEPAWWRESAWDGSIETAGNVQLIANSFTEFVDGLRPQDELDLDGDRDLPKPTVPKMSRRT